MDDQNTNDDNPSHIAVKQVGVLNESAELEKDRIAFGGADGTGEDSLLGGDAPGDDFGDGDPNDPDAGGTLDIDNAKRALGEENDEDGLHEVDTTVE